MRVTRLVLSFLLILASSPRLNSQQSAAPLQRDAQAVGVIQNALAATGSGALGSVQDSVGTFQITRTQSDGTVTTFSATARTLGTGLYRFDLGDLSFVISQSGAVFKKGSDAAFSAAPRAASIAGARHIPALSVLRQYPDPSFQIIYIGVEPLGHATCHHIQMQRRWSTDNLGHDWERPVDVYIDVTTNLLTRLAYSAHPPLHPEINSHILVDYADYRSVSGLMIPFAMTETIGADLKQQYTLQTFAVNQGLQQPDFTLQ